MLKGKLAYISVCLFMYKTVHACAREKHKTERIGLAAMSLLTTPLNFLKYFMF